MSVVCTRLIALSPRQRLQCHFTTKKGTYLSLSIYNETNRKITALGPALLAALLLMLLLPATLAYGAYQPLPSAPNALEMDTHNNHDDDGAALITIQKTMISAQMHKLTAYATIYAQQ